MQTKPLTYTFVTLNRCGVVIRRETGQAAQVVFDIGSGQQLALIALPGGDFQMGSPEGEGYDDEKPRHTVSVRPFLIGRFPITQAQWTTVMGEERALRFAGPNKAMHDLSWPEAVDFCYRLTAVTGHQFRLPSEAEWEYVCRRERRRLSPAGNDRHGPGQLQRDVHLPGCARRAIPSRLAGRGFLPA